MINFTQGLAPTRVQPTAPKITKQDKARLESGLAELAKIDGRYQEIDDLRDIIRASARSYASGEISLAQSVALAGIEGTRVPDVRGALRTGCRELQKQFVLSLAPLVTQHREHIVADLLGRCSEMEKAERQNALNVGITADHYRPSGLLEALREQHLRARRDTEAIITRSDLTRLAIACGIVIPAPPEADPLSALEGDIDLDGEEVGSGLLE